MIRYKCESAHLGGRRRLSDDHGFACPSRWSLHDAPNSSPRKSRASRRRLEGGGGVKSKAQAGQAVSARTCGQSSQADHYRMVRSEDCLSIIDIKHKLFYRFCELILSIDEERPDDFRKPALMTLHTMSLAGSQFLYHFDLLSWICLAQLLVHRAITTNVTTEQNMGGRNLP